MILDGKKLADEIIQSLAKRREKLGALGLGIILVGDSAASEAFIKKKRAVGERLGVDVRIYRFPEAISREELRKAIVQISKPSAISGVIVQLPLPGHLGGAEGYACNAVPPEKDLDCLTERNAGRFYLDRPLVEPPAVVALRWVLDSAKVSVEGKTALVLGYGKLIGRPIGFFLRRKKATVIAASSLVDPFTYLNSVDIIISGVGKAGIVSSCKEGAALIDFGYDVRGGEISGDVDPEKVRSRAALVTPTPGGTGPLVVAAIFENLLTLQERSPSYGKGRRLP